jgi:hypothetical protein
MIDTASFIIPSPKTVLKSLGFSLAEIIETAAITSDEQRREHMTIISAVESSRGISKYTCLSSSHLVYFISKEEVASKVILQYTVNASNVPITPKREILAKFSKNFLRDDILKPAAKTIGGNKKSKNTSLLNLSMWIYALFSCV